MFESIVEGPRADGGVLDDDLDRLLDSGSVPAWVPDWVADGAPPPTHGTTSIRPPF